MWMRLSEFILANREPILVEWESFARTCKPACNDMDIEALRDHADEMLTVIAADLDTPQEHDAQQEKSLGNAPDSVETTAAEDHGADRADSGFTVEQMISEYRALRASVIRLWTKQHELLTAVDHEDVTRFNEAIDQSLAESIQRYTREMGDSKEMFLAMLGHDLRTPLGAITTASTFMLDTGDLAEPHLTLTTRIKSSSERMVGMVGDLLDFTRSRLGGGIPVTRATMCMDEIVHDVVDELGAAYPKRVVDVDARGDQHGDWDAARVSQALTNLIANALQHGDPEEKISVTVGGNESQITVAVHNGGRTIPPDELSGIFDPMKVRERRGTAAASGPGGNLGLGLYIADRIANAHRGDITVTSSPGVGTTFTMRLPRL